MALQDKWPGEILHDDAEIYALNETADQPPEAETLTAVDTTDQPQVQPDIETALDGIVNEVDAPEPGIDRSKVLAIDSGRGTAALSSDLKTVKDPWLERHGAQIGKMLASGVPDADIIEFMKSNGAPAGYSIQSQLDWRHTPEFRIWKQQNPNSTWKISPEVDVPLSAYEQATAAVSANPVGNFAGNASAGALDTMTLGLSDELAGLAGADVESFRTKRDLAGANSPVATTLGQLAGGFIFPSRALAAGKAAATSAFRQAIAGGAARAEARQIAREAARKAIIGGSVKEGAGYGAAYGAGSADGDLADRAAGAITGGLAGGATAGAITAAGTKIAGRTPPSAITPQQEAAQAAQRLEMDLLPADTGGVKTRRATSMMSQTIAGGQPIIEASKRVNTQAQGVRDRIAQTIGQALNPEAAGQGVIEGAKSYRSSSRNEARAFYASAEKATEGFKANARKAIEVLDKNIAELSETPGGAEGLKTLQAIRDDLAKGKTGVAGIRNMRTALRDQFAATGLRGSDIERRVGQVVDAAAEDVTDSLRDAGKAEAARLFESGDRAWRARAKTIDDVLEPIIGKDGNKSGEQVVKTVMADLQSNNARAVKLLNTLPEAEQNNLRASIIGGLGRSSKGNQNAEGDAFSLSQFLTNWNEIGETAKRAYFGPEARAALNDLAKIAEVTKEAQTYANRSNTGGAVGNLLTIGTGVAGLPTLVATVGAQYGLGRLLASPRFARWLARAPKTTLTGPEYLGRLSRIAAAEPAIATDVLGLQRRLQQAFSGSAPTSLAADEAGNGALGVPQDNGQNAQDYPGEELPQ